jgi:tripartite-type tricarboxylate transporter receptor subunit TctC
MSVMPPRSALCAAALALLTFAAGSVHAGEPSSPAYPTKPIRLVVISPPGGSTDLLARLAAQHLGDALGQQVVVDNRAGAGGIVGAEIVASSSPDGHTLLWTHTSHTVLPSLHAKLPYDTLKDFAPVSPVVLFAGVLIVNNALPAKSVKELIALAKAQPGRLNYSAGTTGASAHLSGELLKLMAGVNIVHVPYKGTAAQLASVISGETQMTFATIPAALPHVKAGRVRALAIGSAKRSSVFPDLPTVAEAALPGFDVTAWNGILAPSRTPATVISRLNAEIHRLSQLPEARDRAAAQGAELAWQTPPEFGAYLAAQIRKWSRVVKAAGIRPD